jgi:hypothetical protein
MVLGGRGGRRGEGELEVWRHACVNARGVELANKDGMFCKSNPYLKFLAVPDAADACSCRQRGGAGRWKETACQKAKGISEAVTSL